MIRSVCARRCLPLVLLSCLTAPVAAQDGAGVEDFSPGDDPAQRLRDLERERERLEEREPRDDPVIEIPDLLLPDLEDEEVEFFLEAVRFSPSEFLEDDWLEELAAEYVGRIVSFGDLNAMIERINDAYAEEGLVTARAFVPPQEIRDGEVRVLLVEGRLGEVLIEGAEHTDEAYIRGRIPLTEGEVLRVPTLQASLQDFNRREAVRAGAALQAGDDFGESDVVLQIQEPPRLAYQVFADNAGSRNTGENRVGGFVSWFSPFGRADRLTAFLVGSSGSTAADINYSTPIGHGGAKLETRFAANEIEIVRGPLRDLSVEGDSVRASTRYVHPLARGVRRTWDAIGGLAYVRSRTELDGFRFADSEVQTVRAGLRFRDYAPPGLFGYFLEVEQHVGHSRFRDQAGELNETDSALMWTGNLLWEQRLSDTSYTVLRGDWQYTGDPEAVLSPELYQLGGAFDVRGYPQGVSAGEKGYFASGEIRYSGVDVAEPFAFIDHGGVRQLDQDNESLTSIGLGGFRRFGGGVSGSLTIGYPLTDIVADQDRYQIHLRLAWQGNW